MAKKQGFLPVYDPETKRIFGGYVLPAQKEFTGNETTHCVDYGQTPTPQNTVNVRKIESAFKLRNQNDWFMAAVFTREEIRLEAYKGYPNWKSNLEPGVGPLGYEWLSPASHPQGILRGDRGQILRGMERDFITAVADEVVGDAVVSGSFWYEESSIGDTAYNFMALARRANGKVGLVVDPNGTVGTFATMLGTDGQPMWSKNLADTEGELNSFYFEGAVPTPLGNLLISMDSGAAATGAWTIPVCLAGDTGDVVWKRKVSTVNTLYGAANNVFVHGSSVYYAVTDSPDGGTTSVGCVLKLNLDTGATEACYGFIPSDSTNASGVAVVADDTGIYLAIQTYDGSGDVFIVKVDTSGNKVWENALAGGDANSVKLAIGADGVYLATSTSGGPGVVMKFDLSTGALAWSKKISSAQPCLPSNLVVDGSGNLIFFSDQSGIGTFVGLDPSGTELFATNLVYSGGTAPTSSNFAAGISGDSITVGARYSTNSGTVIDEFILNLPSDGSIPQATYTLSNGTLTHAVDASAVVAANDLVTVGASNPLTKSDRTVTNVDATGVTVTDATAKTFGARTAL